MLTKALRGRDFITLRDFTKHEIETIIETGLALKQDYTLGRPHKLLEALVLVDHKENPGRVAHPCHLS